MFVNQLLSLFSSLHLKIIADCNCFPKVIWPANFIFPRGSLKIKGKFFANRGLYLSTNKYCLIEIGDKVMLGPDVKILGGNHNTKYTGGHIWDFKEANPINSMILIGNGAWIGANVIILDGSEIGEGCVVGAGSVVSGRLDPWTIAVGAPARSIKMRFDSIDDLAHVLAVLKSDLSHEDS